MSRLSDRILNMEEAATLRMARLVREQRALGKDIVNLTLGEPGFDTPRFIRQAANDALHAGVTHYTPVAGLPELREAICGKLKRDNGLDYQPKQIVVSNGAKQSLINTCLALLNPGDEVVLPSPYWVSYPGMIRFAGSRPVPVETGVAQDFKISAAQLSSAINERTRLLILNSPGNPSGSMYSADELGALAGVIEQHPDLYVISDEIYEYITFGEPHCSFASLPGMMERTITVNGMSKGFAMTGWRIGYSAAPEWLAQATAALQGQFTSGANAFAQKASALALESSLQPSRQMCARYAKRRTLALSLLQNIPGLEVNDPKGAFYIFPDAGAYMRGEKVRNSEELCAYLLHEAGVAVVPGAAFGNDHCFRLSFAAASKELSRGIERINDALAKL